MEVTANSLNTILSIPNSFPWDKDVTKDTTEDPYGHIRYASHKPLEDFKSYLKNKICVKSLKNRLRVREDYNLKDTDIKITLSVESLGSNPMGFEGAKITYSINIPEDANPNYFRMNDDIAWFEYSSYPGNCGICVLYHMGVQSSMFYDFQTQSKVGPDSRPEVLEVSKQTLNLAYKIIENAGYSNIQYTHNQNCPKFIENIVSKEFNLLDGFYNRRSTNVVRVFTKTLSVEKPFTLK